MKIIITERQFKFLLGRIVENEEEERWRETSVLSSVKERPPKIKSKCTDFYGDASPEQIIEQGLTDSALRNFDHFKCFLKNVGYYYGLTSKTRGNATDLNYLSKYIDGIEIESHVKLFLLKLGKLFYDNEKSDRIILLKILKILISLGNRTEENIIKLINDVNTLMDDERFDKKRQDEIISLILNQDIDSVGVKKFLDEFYKKINKSLLYEKSFDDENYFKLSQTSPQVNVTLSTSINTKYGVIIEKNEFDNQSSDVNKVLYIIDSIENCENCHEVSIDEVVKDTFSNINFNIEGVGDLDKRDLIARRKIEITRGSINNVFIEKGQGVEVKYKPFKQASFLSEFFKVDSTEKNTNLIKNALREINVDFKFFMGHLVKRLLEAAKNTEIKDELIKNLSGIIFNDHDFFKKSNIDFNWCDKGYANKDRLAVCYKVKPTVPDLIFEKPIEAMGKIRGYKI